MSLGSVVRQISVVVYTFYFSSGALGNNSWCAGQDFERYAGDKSAEPDRIDNLWRNAPAQQANR